MFHTLIECLGSLTDAAGQSIVDECGLEDFWESGVDIHDTSSSNAIDGQVNKKFKFKFKQKGIKFVDFSSASSMSECGSHSL